MNKIISHIVDELRLIPGKRIPSSIYKGSNDKQAIIMEYSKQLESVWCKENPSYIEDNGCYIDNYHVVVLLYTGSLKTDGIINIKKLLNKSAELGINNASKITLELLLQKTTYTYKFTEDNIKTLTRDYSINLSYYKLLDKHYNHIGVTSDIPSCLSDRFTDLPAQVFFEQSLTYKAACFLGRRVYIHGPYEVNLSDPNARLTKVTNELTAAVKLGASGYVLHVGKNNNKIPIDVALKRMEQNLMKLLKYSSISCPILLETPAGQGTELLHKFEDMSLFFKRFSKYPNLQICIDTCHVFASGYDPLTYLIDWAANNPGSIKLVHYNDSKDDKYSRIDRHFAVGGGRENIRKILENNTLIPKYPILGSLGYIGIQKMCSVADWCINNNIPMVTEGGIVL